MLKRFYWGLVGGLLGFVELLRLRTGFGGYCGWVVGYEGGMIGAVWVFGPPNNGFDGFAASADWFCWAC